MRKLTYVILAGVLLFGCKKGEKAGDSAQKIETKAIALLVVGDVKAGGKLMKTGQFLQGDEEIKVGPASMIDLQVKGTRATLRVKENSAVRISALMAQGKTKYSLHLNSGHLLVNVPKRDAEQEFQVVTPAAIASVRGTKFDVFVFSDGKSRTVVFEGSVATRVRISEVESLPPELIENSEALRKVVAVLAEKERVVEAGQESTVTHYVIEADLKSKIDQIRESDAVKGALNRPLTQEEARQAALQIDRDLEDRLADVGKVLRQSHPEAQVEIRSRAAAPPEGYPSEQEFKEFEAVPEESISEDKAAQTVAARNQDAQVRKQLMVRIEKVTGGRLDKLTLTDGRVVEGVVRQIGEDYLITKPEGNETVSGSQVAEIRF